MQTLNKKVFRREDSSIYAYEGGEWSWVPSDIYVGSIVRDNKLYDCYQGIEQCVGRHKYFGCDTGAVRPTDINCFESDSQYA